MALGSDFWLWLRILFAIVKALLEFQNGGAPNGESPGEFVCKEGASVVAALMSDDEPSPHTPCPHPPANSPRKETNS